MCSSVGDTGVTKKKLGKEEKGSGSLEESSTRNFRLWGSNRLTLSV